MISDGTASVGTVRAGRMRSVETAWAANEPDDKRGSVETGALSGSDLKKKMAYN